MTGSAKERLFLAVAVNPGVRETLAAAVDGSVAVPGRVVPPENWHITLRFLGWSEPQQRDRVLAALDEDLQAGGGPAPFALRFGRLGAFPKPRRATVLWLGVDRGSDQLGRLAALCEDAAAAAGFAPEDRPFHAHLTLSRIRPPVDVGALVDGSPTFPVGLDVGAVTLFRSTLLRGGAEYDAVDEIPLR